MIKLDFVDKDDFKGDMKRLQMHLNGSEMASQINKLTRRIRKEVQKDMRDRYALKKSESKLRRMPIMKRAKAGDATAVITITSNMLGLMKYQALKNTKNLPVRARVLQGGSYKPLQKGKFKAFFANMRNGHQGVFTRREGEGRKLFVIKGQSLAHDANKVYQPKEKRFLNILVKSVENIIDGDLK